MESIGIRQTGFGVRISELEDVVSLCQGRTWIAK
jgi:hypothetical protein